MTSVTGPRIIPARAGFTITVLIGTFPYGDHPRSRGVYLYLAAICLYPRGSSPLARGLRPSSRPARTPARIIPARAGFTGFGRTAEEVLSDHPRSRGVYITTE